MTGVDYTLLFDHKPNLTLRYDAGHPCWRWLIADQTTGQDYCRRSTLKQAVQFMRSAARKGDATLDEVSVEFHLRLADPGTWSVRADVLSERGKGLTVASTVGTRGPDPSLMPRSESAAALAGALSERGYESPQGVRLAREDAPDTTRKGPRSESVPALATVLPFRRPLEPLDEEVRA